MSKELEHNKYVKKGIEHINNHKVLKISESFNEIERIKSEKLSIDTSVIEQNPHQKLLIGGLKEIYKKYYTINNYSATDIMQPLNNYKKNLKTSLKLIQSIYYITTQAVKSCLFIKIWS